MEEDEAEPLQKVANRAIKRRAITGRVYVEIPVKKKSSVRFISPCLPNTYLEPCADRQCTGPAPSDSCKRGQ